jgi:glycosyltransferase involved in cell wall biosynthesis
VRACRVPVTVLHVSETTLGGVGGVLADLAAAQADRGWRVCVAAPAHDGLAATAARSGGRLHDWVPGARPGPRLPSSVRALAAVVRAERPDVVHLHTSMAGMCGRIALRRRTPTLFQPHSWSFFAVTGPVRAATLLWERLGARWADVVLCVSEDEKRCAEAAGVRGRFVVVPNGVDLPRWPAPVDGDRQAARGRLGLGADPLVVCVGRLHRQKGQHRLLDAWPQLLRQVPGARLALVGEGPDRESLEARQAPAVTLVGQTSEVRDWVLAADVVVQPSTWEGMSLSLLECMATARSVVVTDVPGMGEVVREGTGAVVPLDDAPALADALAARLLDPALADREGKAGRAQVEAEHDLAVQREKVLALTESLVRR